MGMAERTTLESRAYLDLAADGACRM